jgi:hypothetical protein
MQLEAVLIHQPVGEILSSACFRLPLRFDSLLLQENRTIPQRAGNFRFPRNALDRTRRDIPSAAATENVNGGG